MAASSKPSRTRRAFSAKFKAEVVVSLLSGATTQAELCPFTLA